MTPPDSGFHFQCADPDCPLCAANRAIKPDSGEREVCGHRDPEWCCTRLVGHSGDHRYWHMRNPPPSDDVLLPLSLVQRILTALEELPKRRSYDANELRALAAELREVMPK